MGETLKARTRVARRNTRQRSPFELKLASRVLVSFLRFLSVLPTRKCDLGDQERGSKMGARDATARAHVAQRETRVVAQRLGARAPRVAQPLRLRARSLTGDRLSLGFALAVALGVSLGGVACREGSSTLDAGDAGPPPDTTPKLCATPTACEATRVHACRDGRLAEVIEECGPERTCSRGRCTSLECATTERMGGTTAVASFVHCPPKRCSSVAFAGAWPGFVTSTLDGSTSSESTLSTRSV